MSLDLDNWTDTDKILVCKMLRVDPRLCTSIVDAYTFPPEKYSDY